MNEEYRQKLLQIFPEIDWIQNDAVKAGVIASHAYVMKKSEWKLEDYDKMPFIKSFAGCPVSCLRHTRTVTRMCKMLADEYNCAYKNHGGYQLDLDVVLASAALHDIGKFLEWEKRSDGTAVKTKQGKLLRHPVSGAIVAAMQGLPDEIVHAIFVHSTEGNTAKRSPEAMLVYKVDEMNFDCIRAAMGVL